MRNLEYLFTGVYIQFRPGEKLNPLEYYVRKEFVDKYGLNPETYRDEVLLPQLKELVLKLRHFKYPTALKKRFLNQETSSKFNKTNLPNKLKISSPLLHLHLHVAFGQGSFQRSKGTSFPIFSSLHPGTLHFYNPVR